MQLVRLFARCCLLLSCGISAAAVPPSALQGYGNLPLRFEINAGQTRKDVAYLARGRGHLFLLNANGSLQVSALKHSSTAAALLSMQLANANARPIASVPAPLAGKSHYLLGREPRAWRRQIAHYAQVRYAQVYPGIDLVYYGRGQQLEFDFIVAPGSDPGVIALRLAGMEKLSVDARGDLAISLPGGDLILHKPVVYQTVRDEQRRVAGRYQVNGDRVGFTLGHYDSRHALVIDPALSYSTYLGDIGSDTATAIAVDSSGNAYVTGTTTSIDFPSQADLRRSERLLGSDIFITKLNAAGDGVLYSTYIGGNGDDEANAIALDASGNAYITGSTTSTDLPTQNALRDDSNGGSDAFVVKLDATGGALIYGTYLGGIGTDTGTAIAVDTQGDAFVAGETDSLNFPKENALQEILRGASDAFVSRLSADGGSLIYSTLFGGSGNESAHAISIDAAASARLAGTTSSTDLPLRNALFGTPFGGGDAFIAQLEPDGGDLRYSTYLGGRGEDAAFAIATDNAGNAYVSGATSSTDFFTRDPLQSTLSGARDAFVTLIDPAGEEVLYSTYLGGSGDDEARGIAVDGVGNAYVVGDTSSTDFPRRFAFDETRSGDIDAFIARIAAAGDELLYSTYLGGSGAETVAGVGIDPEGNAYVVGETSSLNFPTLNAFQDQSGGATDAFIAKIDPTRDSDDNDDEEDDDGFSGIFGCSSNSGNVAFDPSLPLMLASLYGLRRRRP